MKKLLAVTLVLVLAGCGPSSSRGYVPTIPAPTRPRMQVMNSKDVVEINKMDPKVMQKLQGNYQALMMYSSQLEIGVQAYNAYAKFNNALVDKQLGRKVEPVKLPKKEEGEP